MTAIAVYASRLANRLIVKARIVIEELSKRSINLEIRISRKLCEANEVSLGC
jgi:hypothetical protein